MRTCGWRASLPPFLCGLCTPFNAEVRVYAGGSPSRRPPAGRGSRGWLGQNGWIVEQRRKSFRIKQSYFILNTLCDVMPGPQKYSNHTLQEKQHARYRTLVLEHEGILEAGPCEVCGAEPADWHHIDYDDPSRVARLCRLHHMQTHSQFGKAAPDWFEDIRAAQRRIDAYRLGRVGTVVRCPDPRKPRNAPGEALVNASEPST
jgi:hypothetical protein